MIEQAGRDIQSKRRKMKGGERFREDAEVNRGAEISGKEEVWKFPFPQMYVECLLYDKNCS
jgi:hypothetical protein